MARLSRFLCATTNKLETVERRLFEYSTCITTGKLKYMLYPCHGQPLAYSTPVKPSLLRAPHRPPTGSGNYRNISCICTLFCLKFETVNQIAEQAMMSGTCAQMSDVVDMFCNLIGSLKFQMGWCANTRNVSKVTGLLPRVRERWGLGMGLGCTTVVKRVRVIKVRKPMTCTD